MEDERRQLRPVDGPLRSTDGRGLTRSELLKKAGAAGILLGAPALLAACGDSAQPAGAPNAGTVGEIPEQPGGTMRIALPAGVGGALDPQVPASLHARIRNWNVFDNLFMFDNAGKLVPSLAEEATPNADATEWTIRLKSDVLFHDGSPLTVEDVIYSLKRILDPKTAAEGMGQIAMIEARGMKKADDTTLVIPLKYPFSIFREALTQYIPIIKDGTKTFTKLNGTGPFKFASGDDSTYTLVRNPNYWQEGLPRLEEVRVQPIQDATARLNALKTGEVDAIYPTDFTESAAVASDGSITTFVNKTSTFMPMYMTANTKPFSDSRVRLALKLAADRTTMNQLAYGGQGVIGNDMFGLTDPGYPQDVEQREFDPEQAASLWKQAGMEGTKLQFWTSAVWPGQVTSATAYAQKAKEAGIDVEVTKLPDDQFSTKIYGVKPFANDYWYTPPILAIMSLGFVPGADYYKTASWSSPETTRLYKQAVAETDDAKRNELSGEIMRAFRDEGPYLIWGFEASPDLYSAKIGGQETSALRGLNGFRLEKFFVKA